MLSAAHVVNDWYMNYLQTILPLLALSLGVARASWLITAFTMTSSLVQPLFGAWLGKHTGRWPLFVGTIWMAVLLSLTGLSSLYPLSLALASLAGLGTAVFHPAASAMVASLGGERKSFLQSLFIAGGNVGWALAPLAMFPFLNRFGIGASPWLVVPGILVSLALVLVVPKPKPAQRSVQAKGPKSITDGAPVELVKIMLIIACRSLSYFGLIAFLPLYLKTKGVPLLSGSFLLFVMLLCGAIGGIVGGWLADGVGRKRVLVVSLASASPFFFVFSVSSGFGGMLVLGLAGACLLASFSVTVVMAQKLITGNAALASGLALGFGTGIGGLGVGLLGTLMGRIGVNAVIIVLMALPLLSAAMGLTLKDRG